MQDRRLFFRVLVKLLIVAGLLFFVWILINSLSSTTQFADKTESLPVVELDISDMQSGFIRKTQWNGKEVAVLLRPDTEINPSHLKLTDSDNALLNAKWRSLRPEYFVYFNSSRCPLYYSQRMFKDICTQKKFDETGREIKVKNKPDTLAIPPHYFKDKTVIFGRWKK